MKQIRKRLTYANVMSSLAVFLVLGGATAIAASKKIGPNQLKANSVKTGKIVKEAVTAGKIKKNAVGTSKLSNGSVTTEKIANDAVTGEKANESTFGEVPSAVKATTASNLVGQRSYVLKLNAGEEQVIATNGAVSAVAKCEAGIEGGINDRLRILALTTVNGALMAGDTPHLGPGSGEFLDAGTPESERELTSVTRPAGTTGAEFDIDRGWVLGPEGKMLGFNAEGQALALNYAGAKCLVGGVTNASG